MSLLPEVQFFELVRVYLGKIQTPFNKQNLIDNLASFLRKDVNKQKIASLLTKTELKVLAAVCSLNPCKKSTLAQFFSRSVSENTLDALILNLEERLILFSFEDKQTGSPCIAITPYLEETIKPLAQKKLILEPAKINEQSIEEAEHLSPELIAAFVSFLHTETDICKADGTFKKKISALLDEIFPKKARLLQAVTTAFMNLLILKEKNGEYQLDYTRLKNFAELESAVQYAYICVAAAERVSRTELVRRGQILIETAMHIPQGGYENEMLLRSAFLIAENQNDAPGIAPIGLGGRFSQLLKQAQTMQNNNSDAQESQKSEGKAEQKNLYEMLEKLFESAVNTGFFEIAGTSENGETVYKAGKITDMENCVSASSSDIKTLTIDAGFNITLMPGLSLKELIPLMEFMNIVHFDTAASFEITRKSIMKGFDEGLTTKSLMELLEKHCLYEIPQNLVISIEDWSRSYASATLYNGYVLKISQEFSTSIEKNPTIQKAIKEILAPGIYLLSVQDEEEASNLIAKSGLDFIGSIKTTKKQPDTVGFPRFLIPKKSADFTMDSAENVEIPQQKDIDEHLQKMHEFLNEMELTKEQRECLELRINRKAVINTEQLKADSVRFEIVEAGAMDFAGKVHIIEDAIAHKNDVELTYEDESKSDARKVTVVRGTPLSLERSEQDSSVLIKHEDKMQQQYSVARARLVRRIRTTILQDF